MKGKEKNIFIAGALGIIATFILTAFFIGSGLNTTLILQPDTNEVINQTQDEVQDIIDADASQGNLQGENNAQRLANIPFETQKKSTITLYGFAENDIVTTPLVFAGKIPSSWVFDGKIGLDILSETGAIIQQGFAEADVFDSYGEIISGDVEFSVNMEIPILKEIGENVGQVEKGKLRLSSKNPNLEDSIDVAVLFQ